MAEPDYKALLDNLPGLYLVLDPGLRIVAASNAYLQATLTDRASILGRSFFDVFSDGPGALSADALRDIRASLDRVLATRAGDSMTVQPSEVRRPEAEGNGFVVRYWRPTNSPILDPDGSVAYIVHQIEDVTGSVKPSKEAAEPEELKSRFLAAISDELCTRLTLILGPLERLDREVLDPGLRKVLGSVRLSARKLQRRVGDLLDMAKVEAGQMQLNYVRTDVVALTRLVASFFDTPATDRGLRYELDTPATLEAEVDIEKFERILLNLLSNAFNFTPDRGHVRLRLAPIDGRLHIEVEDNGPGVPPPPREAIFERFRGEGGAPRWSGGTGLGLVMVRELAGLQGGSLAVRESALGGALFAIDLPLLAPAGSHVAEDALRSGEAGRQAADELVPRRIGAGEIPVPRDVGAPHVLIVEDHPEMSVFLAQSLGRHYWVSRAFDGQEAVRKALLPDRPDLIIAEITLPGMSGDAMIDELRRHSAMADIPVVMLTAKADDAMRLRLLRRGVHDYLQKPFSLEELLLRVETLLAERKRMKRLLESEDRYRTLFNSIDEGFCIVRIIFDESDKAIDYRFIETNASFEQQSGMFDVQGKRMRELVPEMEDEWFETYGKVALTGEPSRFDIRSDLLQRWFNAFAFRYGPPEQRQVAILFKDITARKQSEEVMREADRRKDQFLALLAHELRNPLAPIRNAVHILRLSPAAQAMPASQLLPMMERQLAHMARLLDDLLDVSRIANGKIELRTEEVDMAQAVQAAVEANKPLIEAMGHEISVTLPPQPVMLVADPVRLAQVVSNLLNNAANYSASGGRIAVSVQREDSEIRLSVKDSGVGISAKDLDNVFGLFVQVGSPFSRPQSGLGIGLALVRTLVSLHGGRVEARSEGPGKGSEFIVRLPALAEQGQPELRSFSPARSGA
jgi:PAS domain S-box-containing protein